MKIRALLYDLGRNLRADVGYLESVVDDLADLGFNMMIINLEHRFDFPSCPGSAPAGALTTKTARALVAYGRSRGVEVVGQPNVMGHCEGMNATERYAHLSADPWTQLPWGGYEMLNLDLPEARDRAAGMIRDACDAFPGEYLHIGGDEVRCLQYLYPGDETRQQAKRMEFFDYVIGTASKTGRKIMMWGDMPLKQPAMMKRLPRDIIICDWHYEPEGSRASLELYKREGFKVLAAPGVLSCDHFAVSSRKTADNLNSMIGDASSLDLEGMLVTTWHSGHGNTFDVCWPWIAMAAQIARGSTVDDYEGFVGGFAAQRYGVSGAACNRLVHILGQEFPELLDRHAGPSANWLGHDAHLRKLLFRGVMDFPQVMRHGRVPDAIGVPLWEPSPFHVWLYARPILSERVIASLEKLAQEVSRLVVRLRREATHRQDELASLLEMGRAFCVLVSRFRILDTCKAQYHRAALAQGRNARRFSESIERAAKSLEDVTAGLKELERTVKYVGKRNGYDLDELKWIELQKRSCRRHVSALRRIRCDGQPMLEFGEFLRRPVDVTQRLLWR